MGTYHDRLEIDWTHPDFDELSVLIVYLRRKDRYHPPLLYVKKHYSFKRLVALTHTVRFTSHMERPALELVEVLKENRDEGGNILRSFLCGTLHGK